MEIDTDLVRTQADISLRFEDFFGNPSWPGVDTAKYEHLRASIAAYVQPKDFIDWMLIFRITDELTTLLHYRNLKAEAISAARVDAVRDFLQRVVQSASDQVDEVIRDAITQHGLVAAIETLAWGWHRRRAPLFKAVQQLLENHHVDREALYASAFMREARRVEKLDKLMASAEARVDASLVQLERRRGPNVRAVRSNLRAV